MALLSETELKFWQCTEAIQSIQCYSPNTTCLRLPFRPIAIIQTKPTFELPCESNEMFVPNVSINLSFVMNLELLSHQPKLIDYFAYI